MRLTKHIEEDFAIENNAKRHGPRQSPAAFLLLIWRQTTARIASLRPPRSECESGRGLPRSKIRAFCK